MIASDSWGGLQPQRPSEHSTLCAALSWGEISMGVLLVGATQRAALEWHRHVPLSSVSVRTAQLVIKGQEELRCFPLGHQHHA